MTIQRQLDTINRAYKQLQSEKKGREKEIRQLNRAGVLFATISHKRQTTRKDGGQRLYARLLYPSDGTGRRKSEYLGTDEKKIQNAEARIERGRQLRVAERDLVDIERQLDNIKNAVIRVIQSNC